MPVIRVRSLKFEKTVDISTVIETISYGFSEKTGIDVEHVTVTWEFFESGHYGVSGKTSDFQPADTHPVLVDLLIPDFNSPDMIETMLNTIAESISCNTEVLRENIFINCSLARSGMVFDGGQLVKW